MASLNNLTAFMPSFYAGLNKVQQEQTDSIDAVNMNASLEQAVIGQTITYPIAPVAVATDTSYSGIPLYVGDTAGTGTLSLSKSKSMTFAYNGEEIQQLQLGGIYSNYYADQLAQRVRGLRKLVANDIVSAALSGACRTVGTAGTDPFSTVNVLTGFAGPNKILNDNGAPGSDRHMILNTSTVSSVQGYQATLFRANEAGTDRLLRTGSIGTVEGFQVGMDTQLASVSTFGNATGMVDATALTVGQTSLVMTSGSGTPIAGDIFTFDGTNNYVVNSWTASTKTITINNPGIMVAVPVDTTATFVSTAYRPNLVFTRDAITLIARQPLLPYSGPSGQLLDLTTIPDPRSGLTYQLAMWQNGRTILIELALVWGVGVTNSQDLALLIG
jgi:P22 coat protein - gene protein 5